MSTPTAPGWYQDPEDPDQLRYFDGIIWSSHTTPRTTPSAPVHPEPTGAVPTGWGPPPGSGQQGWGQQQEGWGQPPQGQQPGEGQQPGQQPGWGQQQPWGQQPNPWAAPPVGDQAAWGPVRSGVLPDGAVLAEWWRRLVARLVDGIVVSLIGALLTVGFLRDLVAAVEEYWQAALAAAESGTTPDTSQLESALFEAAVPITLIGLAVTVLYEVVFLVWRGATPGKMLLGTVVRPAVAAGPVSFGVALRRQLILIATNVVGLVPIVGVLATLLSILDPAWLLWDPRRQALHDKVADTVVVLRRP